MITAGEAGLGLADGTGFGLAEGRVLAARGGFYQVLPVDSSVNADPLNCRLRGKLKRRRGDGVLVGDMVRVSLHGADDVAMVEEILERKNSLPRPRIANISLCVAVLAARDPLYDLLLLDKILLTAAYYGAAAAICFNKADLAGDDLAQLIEIYRRAGFNCAAVSAQSGRGLDDLRALLNNQASVLAGPSGVGKSSLLNALLPQLNAPVGDISARLQRGKHTTRHVSLLPLPQGGLVADSPGFSLLDLPAELEPQRLPLLYPEFTERAVDCRFIGCLHHNEPDCAVKQAVQNGGIDLGRYERYLRFLTEVQNNSETR